MSSLTARESVEGQPLVPLIFPLSEAGTAIISPLLDAARSLCIEYKDTLLSAGVPIDDFQNFSEEISALPGKFKPSQGGNLWLALLPAFCDTDDSNSPTFNAPYVHLGCRGRFAVVGIVALRDMNSSTTRRCGEIKRLYVRPTARRLSAAQLLMNEVEIFAKTQGYTELLLDTLERLPQALKFYSQRGYTATSPYNDNPMTDAVWLHKLLPTHIVDTSSITI